MTMMNKRLAALSVLVAILIALLSGCHGGMRSETVIIPGAEEEHAADPASKPFQVKTIYRLPVSDTDNAQLLGWTNSDSVVGLFQAPGSATRLTQNLQRSSPPYENLEVLQNVDAYLKYIVMSPNGKYITGIKITDDSHVLKSISLSDGVEQIIETINPRQTQVFSGPFWSDNSRYISYLLMDAATYNGRIQTDLDIPAGSAIKLAVYDTTTGQISSYPLSGLEITGWITRVKMSDDGQSVLFAAEQNKRTASLGLGRIHGSGIDIEYGHEEVGEQMAWLNQDQFVFLGIDGTLYEYDRRNKALSILLEKVISFQLSPDRKYIAYSKKDNDSVSIFAGKLQGNNILYNESVYQGFVPTEMFWSLNNDSLMINGKKIYSTEKELTNTEPGPALYNQPLIIKFQ